MPSDRKLYSSIHEAVRDGNVEELESMVKIGASLNEVDEKDKFTPLHWAAHCGALEVMHWLLWHGADTTVATPRGWTPVHIAAIRGQDACMQALANNGANLSARDVRGSTPTHLASSHGNSFTLHSILRSGVDVNAVDKNGWSPVHSACYHGRLGCLQLLVKWGANIDDVDGNGNTAGHLCSMEGHLACLKYLVATASSATQIIAARNDQGETPKTLAQQFYKDHIVDYINGIEWDRDHPEDAENLAFPAHVSAYNGDLDHLRMLIENGVVNINERDAKGATPAHKAAGQGHIHILQWLIEMGANMSIANTAGETPKDVGARFSQLACVKLLGGDEEAELEGEDGEVLEDSDEEVGYSRPTTGNTEGDGLTFTDRQKKEARGRAKKKFQELERLYEIAKKNFVQLGGKVAEDRRKLRESRDSESEDQLKEQARTLAELKDQLEYERIRRETLEGQLDEYRREIAHLNRALQAAQIAQSEISEEPDYSQYSRKPAKKVGQKKKKKIADGGVFIRRNFVPSASPKSSFKIF